jgi:rhomboid family GlyGly-CTERM serine protease
MHCRSNAPRCVRCAVPSSAEADRLPVPAGLSMNRPSLAWCALIALMVLPSLVVFVNPELRDALIWRPTLVAAEPWRAVGAAWVHLSALHLGANVVGTVLVGALGIAARLPLRASLAWGLAWPLTQLGLLALPALTRYGGLSGVLHAGVAVIAVELIARRDDRRDRRLGWAIAAVLAFKLLTEAPWRGPLAYPAGWDIAVAPAAHLSGALSGLLVALLLIWSARQPR